MEQTTPLISIIVPVYKVEEYLPVCIDSILAQTYENFELILVDDGSPDNCGQICNEYAQKDNRIKVIHQENGGVTKARATGVNHASGEFITFVDSDDTIPNDAIESLCKCISPNIDIIIGRVLFIFKDHKINNFREDTYFSQFNNESTIFINYKTYQQLQLSHMVPVFGGPYAKLFRRKLFDNNTFNIPREIIFGEDWLMNIRLAFNVETNILILNKNVYNYNQMTAGITQRFNGNRDYEMLFMRHYIKSIPKQLYAENISPIIQQKMHCYILLTGYSYSIPQTIMNFRTVLCGEINEYHYKLSTMEKCLLYTTNPFIRFIIVNLRKTLNKLNIRTIVNC